MVPAQLACRHRFDGYILAILLVATGCAEESSGVVSALPVGYHMDKVREVFPHLEQTQRCVHSNQLDEIEVVAAISSSGKLPDFLRQANALFHQVGYEEVAVSDFATDRGLIVDLYSRLLAMSGHERLPHVFRAASLAIRLKYAVLATEGRCTVSSEVESFIAYVLAISIPFTASKP